MQKQLIYLRKVSSSCLTCRITLNFLIYFIFVVVVVIHKPHNSISCTWKVYSISISFDIETEIKGVKILIIIECLQENNHAKHYVFKYVRSMGFWIVSCDYIVEIIHGFHWLISTIQRCLQYYVGLFFLSDSHVRLVRGIINLLLVLTSIYIQS